MVIEKEILMGLGSKFEIDYLEIMDFINLSIKKIIVAKKIPVSSDEIQLKLLNEYATENYTPDSNLEIAVLFDAAHIELNTLKFNKNILKKRFINILNYWKQYKKHKKQKRRENKNTEDIASNQQIVNKNKYTFNNLLLDIHDGLTYFFDEKTTIYNTGNKIIINCKHLLGINIVLYLGNSLLGKKFKIYFSEKFVEIDFNRRFENLTYKSVSTKRKVYNLGRMLNSIYFNYTDKFDDSINQILLESCLNHCPDVLYKNDDITICFYQIVSYLCFINFEDIKSIVNKDKTIYEEKLISKLDISKFQNFLKNLKE